MLPVIGQGDSLAGNELFQKRHCVIYMFLHYVFEIFLVTGGRPLLQTESEMVLHTNIHTLKMSSSSY